MVAGISENLINPPNSKELAKNAALSCTVDNCCDGVDCPPEVHRKHHSLWKKFLKGLHYALFDLWDDLVGWFFIGIIIAGLVTVLVPDDMISRHLGGGLSSMFLMLAFGIPLYICATASTPIAAALILKGVSPGTALIFLLVGPATNVTSLSVLTGILGKRATALYLISISLVSIACGLILDWVYLGLGLNATAQLGQAAEVFPRSVMVASSLVLLLLSIAPLWKMITSRLNKDTSSCGCSSHSCQPKTPIDISTIPLATDNCSCGDDHCHSDKTTHVH